jgi:hypothetical protein
MVIWQTSVLGIILENIGAKIIVPSLKQQGIITVSINQMC